jgi:hypothetical protein
MKINELQEGVEYYGTFCGVKGSNKYKVENGVLLFYNVTYSIWMTSEKSYNEIVDADFEPCEWMPKIGDIYYYPNFTEQLVGASYWRGFKNELTIKRNVGVYSTREEAITKSKELGWT